MRPKDIFQHLDDLAKNADKEQRIALQLAKYAVLLIAEINDEGKRLLLYMPEAVNRLAEGVADKLDKAILYGNGTMKERRENISNDEL